MTWPDGAGSLPLLAPLLAAQAMPRPERNVMQNDGLLLWIVGVLGAVAMVCIVGTIALALEGKETPTAVTATMSAALGALLALVRPPTLPPNSPKQP